MLVLLSSPQAYDGARVITPLLIEAFCHSLMSHSTFTNRSSQASGNASRLFLRGSEALVVTGHQSHANRASKVQSHFVCLCLSSDGDGESKPAPRCAQTEPTAPRPGEVEPLLDIEGSAKRRWPQMAEEDVRQHRFGGKGV